MGDVFDDMRDEGHLSARQHLTAMLLLRDLRAHHGTSAGLVGDISPRVQMCAQARLAPPDGRGGVELGKLDVRLARLRSHERRLMGSLVMCREKARGTLADLGRMASGYKTSRTTRAVMVGRIGALLDTLAEEYLGPEGAV
jgi:hypothetical protein